MSNGTVGGGEWICLGKVKVIALLWVYGASCCISTQYWSCNKWQICLFTWHSIITIIHSHSADKEWSGNELSGMSVTLPDIWDLWPWGCCSRSTFMSLRPASSKHTPSPHVCWCDTSASSCWASIRISYVIYLRVDDLSRFSSKMEFILMFLQWGKVIQCKQHF